MIFATAIWLPNVHRFYRVDRETLATQLARREPAGVASMRNVNPEWDFMLRTYRVLGLSNRALSHADERASILASIDRIVDDTIATREREGDAFFLLSYGHAPLLDSEAKSIFIDGEILLMIAARDTVSPRPSLRAHADLLAARIDAQMKRSPTASGESYPNEAWTFCNTTALAALTLHDRTTGSDHRDVARAWVSWAKNHLLDANTGVLAARYRYDDGTILDGVEGSSIFMSAQNLLVVDPAFARDQYDRAKRALGVSFLGFGWAKEWPDGVPPRPDVDSGAIVPILHASPGASGFALLGASAFGDTTYRDELLASLELAAFPDHERGRYRASNDVGDAVLLYALEVRPASPDANDPREASR